MSIDDPHIAALQQHGRGGEKRLPGQRSRPIPSLALAAYLAGRYAGKKPRKSLKQFSDHQARLVLDYIHANLELQSTFFDLSNLVQLSPRQFFRRFSNTFGTTPHRYIMNERVRQAKEFLLRGQLLVEIATILGFASQSHFSSVFRKSPACRRVNFDESIGKFGLSFAGTAAVNKPRFSLFAGPPQQ